MAKKKKTPAPKTKNPLVVKLGKRIKELREQKGYTNFEHFAYDHGFARTQYNRYEKGEDMRFSTLMRLIESFEMTPKEFFEDGF